MNAPVSVRHIARNLRKRLFISTCLLGVVGAMAILLYIRFVIGISGQDIASVMVMAPAVLAFNLGVISVVTWHSTRPLMAFMKSEHDQATVNSPAVLRAASSAPYRVAASVLVTWIMTATLVAVGRYQRGGLPGETWQIFGGIAAVGIGIFPFQVAAHRGILRPVRDAAALCIVRNDQKPQRSRLSLRAKLLVAFGVLITFGGIFALLNIFAEHERFLAAAAAAEAQSRLDLIISARGEQLGAAVDDLPKLMAMTSGLNSEREKVKILVKGRIWGEPELSLPQELAQAAIEARAGYGAFARLQSSIAFRPLSSGVMLAVLRPWRDPGRRDVAPLLLVFTALVLASAGLVRVTVQEITGPVGVLTKEARRIGGGDLSQPVPPPDSDELGELAGALEYARRELAAKVQSIEEMNASLERRFQEAMKEVVHAEKMASLGRLVAGIAHEINNPLNFVQNSLSPLKQTVELLGSAGASRGELDLNNEAQELRELLRVMENGVARMGVVVRALNDFSRQSAKGTSELVDLERLVDDAAALLRHDLKGRITLVKELEFDKPIKCQPGPITQVLINLFKNAAQAIEGAGTIWIISRAVENGVQIVVRDSGKGISLAVISQIFEPFFTTKSVGEGTGLGLAIVHGIIQDHGGRIECASQEGQGTEFTITLPQKMDNAS